MLKSAWDEYGNLCKCLFQEHPSAVLILLQMMKLTYLSNSFLGGSGGSGSLLYALSNVILIY